MVEKMQSRVQQVKVDVDVEEMSEFQKRTARRRLYVGWMWL